MVTLRRIASCEVRAPSSVNTVERKLPASFGISRKSPDATALSIATDSTIARSGDANANIVLQITAAKITAAFPIGASNPPINPDSE